MEIILSGSILLSLILVFKLLSNNYKLRNELTKRDSDISDLESKNSSLLSRIKSMNEKGSLIPGDKAVMFDYPLTAKKERISFKVTYEVEIVEVTEKNVKVKALDYTSDDDFAKDISNKAGIIAFMQDRWVSISSIELIINKTSEKRNSKIDSILS